MLTPVLRRQAVAEDHRGKGRNRRKDWALRWDRSRTLWGFRSSWAALDGAHPTLRSCVRKLVRGTNL